MLRLTLSRLGVWQSPTVILAVIPARGAKKSAPSGTSLAEFDPTKYADVAPPEPYSSREAAPRSDAEYDYVDPVNFTKHKKTLDPRRYVADVEELENSSLSSEISPSGERYVSKLVLSMKSSCYSTLRSYFLYSNFAAECLDIKTSYHSGKLVTGVYTVNRSPHVHGDHKDRYKRDIWNRKLILHDISGTTADVYLSYVQRNIPAGLTMAVTEQRLTEIPQDFLHSFYSATNSSVMAEGTLQPGVEDKSADESPG